MKSLKLTQCSNDAIWYLMQYLILVNETGNNHKLPQTTTNYQQTTRNHQQLITNYQQKNTNYYQSTTNGPPSTSNQFPHLLVT